MVMPRTNLVFRRFVVTCCRVVLLSWVIACSPASAQVPEKSCDGFLLPPRQVKGKAVGPTSCLMQETGATYEGRALTRLDVGLDGTLRVWIDVGTPSAERLHKASKAVPRVVVFTHHSPELLRR